MPRDAQAKDAPAHTFLIEPFDIMLHATDTGVQALVHEGRYRRDVY